MDIKTEILPWIRDLSVIFSVSAAAIGYWVRIRIEQKRVIKRVLFQLLELRYKARFLAPPPKESIEGFTKRYCSALKKNQVGLEEEIAEELMAQCFSYMFEKHLMERAQLPEGFEESFRNSLNALSETYPLIAFQFTGSDELGRVLNQMDTLSAEVLSTLPMKEEDATQLPAMFKLVREHARRFNAERHIEALDLLIKTLSKRCGIFEWSRTKYALNTMGRDSINPNEDDMKKFTQMAASLVKGYEDTKPSQTSTETA
jgi:hypothetical protein